MRRFYPWLMAISLMVCAVLVFVYLHSVREVALIRAELTRSLAQEEESRRQIAGLNHKLATVDIAQKTSLVDHVRSAAPKQPLAIHQHDIAREFPEYAALWQKRIRRLVIAQWGDALASLNLPADRLARLKNLLVERLMSDEDAKAAADDAGLLPGSSAYNEAIRQARESIQQQIASLIGQEAMAKLDENQGITVFKSEVAATYQIDFTDAGMPMTADQSFAMARVLMEIRNPVKNPVFGSSSAGIVDPTTGLTLVDNQVLSQAAPILSPAQLEILRNHQIDQHRTGAIIDQFMHIHNRDDYSSIDY